MPQVILQGVRVLSIRLFIFFVSVILLFVPDAQSQVKKSRPKIGLVFAGGGALGSAHVGVLKVLEENRIPIDMVAGTSMGALVGAAVAAGTPLEEMERVLRDTDWDKLFDETPPRNKVRYRLKSGVRREIFADGKIGISDGQIIVPTALIEGQHVVPLFDRLYRQKIDVQNFDDLPIPFRALAADLETGESIVLDGGDLAMAARASMSVPGAFSPIKLENRTLVDGGIANNMPVNVVLDMGADVLIVVGLHVDMAKADELGNPLSVLNQMLTILLKQNTAAQEKLIREKDIYIKPDLTGFGSTDFGNAGKIIDIGEKVAREHINELKKLSISPEEYQTWKYNREKDWNGESPIIEFVEVKNESLYTGEIIKEILDIPTGAPLDYDKVDKEVAEIYNTGNFKRVSYDVVKRDGKTGLELTVEEKEWYKQYLRLGFSAEDDFNGNSRFRLGASLRFNALNSWGAHSTIDFVLGQAPYLYANFYQPLGLASPYFVSPEFFIGRKEIFARRDDDVIAEYDREQLFGTVRVGRSIGTIGEAGIGYRRGIGRADRRIGDPSLNETNFEVGEAIAYIDLDALDKVDFSQNGYKFSVDYLYSDRDLGSTGNFQQGLATIKVPFSWGEDRNTITLSGDAGISSSDTPVERYFSLGGFFDLSGFLQDGLYSKDFYIGRLMYFRRFYKVGSGFLGLDLFGGRTAEYAGVKGSEAVALDDYNQVFASSIFVGADTPILPIYFGYGLNSTNSQTLYLGLGRITSGTRRQY